MAISTIWQSLRFGLQSDANQKSCFTYRTAAGLIMAIFGSVPSLSWLQLNQVTLCDAARLVNDREARADRPQYHSTSRLEQQARFIRYHETRDASTSEHSIGATIELCCQ